MKRNLVTLDLSRTEIDQLLRYCDWAEESGVYYGPVVAFKKRHLHIVRQLEEAAAKTEERLA